MDRFTVFLIDDDVGTLTALSGFLRAAGYAIKTYYSSQAFLSGHDVSIPGCVILDLSLPGLNGLDVQQSLLDQGIERPVIFISGKTAAPEIVRAMRAGAIVNRQPWMFTVVHDQKLLESISRLAKTNIATGCRRYSDQFGAQLADPQFHIFYHAPVLILISALDEEPWAVENGSLAAQNMMLLAHSLGLWRPHDSEN